MIFNFWLMGKIPDHYTLILVVVGIFYGAAFMLVCLKVKEGEYPPVGVVEARPRTRGFMGLASISGVLFQSLLCLHLRDLYAGRDGLWAGEHV